MVAMPILTEIKVVKGPPQGQWTYADWEALPDDGNRYEIIEGALYMSTSPSYFHQWILQQLYAHVGLPALTQKLGYASIAPIGVLMPRCDPVQPDFVFVRASRASIIYDRRIRGVSDLIVEVLSPGNKDYDEDVKLTAYANAGVPEYGVIDPAAKQLRLYSLNQPGEYALAKSFAAEDTVTFDCLQGITFVLNDLFAGSPDTTL